MEDANPEHRPYVVWKETLPNGDRDTRPWSTGWALAEQRVQTDENGQRHNDEQRRSMAGPCLPKDGLKPAVKLIRCHGLAVPLWLALSPVL